MRVASVTLGCKVNQYETQAMETELRERGHEICRKDEHPDVYIINTCAVTAESGRKSRQAVRRALQADPGAIVAVCGCFSQLSPEETKALGAHLVSGSAGRMSFVDEIERIYKSREEKLLHDDPLKRRAFEPLPAGSASGRTRALLKIEDGCVNFCSYCIIPYVRGPVRSLAPEDAVREAVRLRGEGYTELVITGIEISSYGRDLKDGTGLPELVSKIAAAAPGMRLRLGSLEPSVVTEDFCDRLPKEGLCCHFHLSAQSGSSETLRRMNRKYDAPGLISAARLLEKYFLGCALTADFITGFPGETEEEFRETLETAERCGFFQMHVFPYSVRPGTAAASMDGHVPESVKAERAARMRELGARMKRRYLDTCVGRDLSVLPETKKDGACFGHAANYCPVRFRGPFERGKIVTVHITGVSGEELVGNMIN